jgi:heptaprenyl diphosphate synthase
MTCSAVDAQALADSRRQTFLALFIALAVVLHTLEALLPNPIPWFRLGSANILTVAALVLFGIRAAWTLTLARIVIGSLLLGNLFAPAFLLSLAGGICGTALMALLWKLAGRLVGPVGLSALGAAGHGAGQMLVASVLMRHADLWRLWPPLFLFSVLSGLAIGLVTTLLLERLRRHVAFSEQNYPNPAAETAP